MTQEERYYALEAAGVDNWSGYDFAIEMAEEEKWLKKTVTIGQIYRQKLKWIISTALALITGHIIVTHLKITKKKGLSKWENSQTTNEKPC